MEFSRPLQGCRLNSTASLEAELRSEAHPQVVVGAVIEENIVANFCTNTDGPGKHFKSSARIHREVGRSVGEADRVGEAGRGILVRNAEIVESDLARDENTEGTGSSLKLRAKETMQSAELRVYQLRAHAIAKGIAVVAFEVIRHFGFQLHAGANVDGRPSSQTDEVSNGRCIRKPKVVCKCSDLNVIGMILRHHHRRSHKK